jgi:hypothetical protein
MNEDRVGSAEPSSFTYWTSVDAPRGRRVRCSREELARRLQRPRIAPVKESLPGWSPTLFRGDYRTLENVERCQAIGHDVEKLGTSWEGTIEALQDYAGFVHTTYSHTPEAHRLRAVVWTDRDVTAEEYRRCWRYLRTVFESAGQSVDHKPSDPSRLWFLPGIVPGGEYRFLELQGALLDVEEALRVVPPIAVVEAAPCHNAPSGGQLVERARRYLEKCEPASSGSGGHNTTFITACRLVRGFGLDEGTAYSLMTVWNQRCKPPWSELDLRRKVKQAAEQGRFAVGELRDGRR